MAGAPRAPSWPELLRTVLDARLEDVHVALPGEVVSYNRSTQTADVRPVVHRPGGEELPTIQRVPVLWPRAGSGYLVMPMDVGDSVLLVFCERDHHLWRDTGEAREPGDLALHGIQGAVAIPGFYPRASTVNQPSGEVVVLSGDAVHLGDYLASKKIVHDGLWPDFGTFLAKLLVWGAGVGGTGWADVADAIADLQGGILAGSYDSATVKVED